MSNSNKENFLNGCLSSLASCIFLQPFDVIKTQIQETSNKATSQRSSYIKLLTQQYTKGGIVSFWKGISKDTQLFKNLLLFIAPTIIRNVPGTGLYFLSLNFLNNINRSNSAITNLTIGSLSRVFAGQILMPFTVLKVKLEVNR